MLMTEQPETGSPSVTEFRKMLAGDMPIAEVAKYWKRTEAELELIRDAVRDSFTITAVTVGERGKPTLIFADRGRLTLSTREAQRFAKTFGKDVSSWIGQEISIIPQSSS
jgi:hypothetical protein